MSDKTEEPTPKRLRKARDEGDSGASVFASQSIGFLVALVVLPAAARALVSRAAGDLRVAIAHAADKSPVAAIDAPALGGQVIALAVPALLAAGAAATLFHLVQTGGAFASKRLAPAIDRLDLASGFAKLFSGARLFAIVRAFVFAALVSWLSYLALREHATDLARTSGRLAYVGATVAEVGFELARDAALLGLALGALDIVVTRRSWLARLRMTKAEVKREQKESEGDPEVKAARMRAHQEALASAEISEVERATVLIVARAELDAHLACALRYDEGKDNAPILSARWDGVLARRAEQEAIAHAVPVVDEPRVARALMDLALGEAIPESLYDAVAEVLREAWAD